MTHCVWCLPGKTMLWSAQREKITLWLIFYYTQSHNKMYSRTAGLYKSNNRQLINNMGYVKESIICKNNIYCEKKKRLLSVLKKVSFKCFFFFFLHIYCAVKGLPKWQHRIASLLSGRRLCANLPPLQCHGIQIPRKWMNHTYCENELNIFLNNASTE